MTNQDRKSFKPTAGGLVLLVVGFGLVALFVTALATSPGTVLGTALAFGALAFLGALLGNRERRWVRTETYRVDPTSGQRTLIRTTPWRYLGEFFLTGPVGAFVGGTVFGLALGTGIALLRPLFSGRDNAAAPQEITALAFSPDGRMVAVAFSSSSVALLNTATGTVGATLPQGATTVVFGGTDGAVAVSDARGVRVYDAVSLNLRADLGADPALSLAFGADASSLVAVHRECGTTVWSLTGSGEPIRFANHEAEQHTDTEATVSYQGRFVAARSLADLVIRRVSDGAEVGRHATVAFRANAWGVAPNGLAISDDGRRLASGDDNIIRVWGSDSLVLPGHQAWVNALAMDSAGTVLVSGGDDHRVRLWDLATGALVAVLGARRTGHDRPVVKVAITPDGNKVASADDGGAVILWDIPQGKVLWKVDGQP